MQKDVFQGKRILITGGTGSLGRQLFDVIKNRDPKKVVILSRDENKQYHMLNEIKNNPLVDFKLGDIRDEKRVMEITKNIDLIIHAAALKHVPPGETDPMEFIKTNILGSQNLIQAAIENEVPQFLEIGTDKAVKPVNTYGMTKAIQEKLMVAASNQDSQTTFLGVRYGNVIGSRGSVIPFFKDKIQKGEKLPITVPEMTRYLLHLREATELIEYAIGNAKGGEIFVKKMPAANIVDLAKAMGEKLAGNPDYPIQVIGIRAGEKIDELLVSEDEMIRSVEEEDHYTIYQYGKLKEPKLLNPSVKEYSSKNTKQLSRKEIIDLLEKEGSI